MVNEVVKYHNDLNTIKFKDFTGNDLDIFFAICSKIRNQKADVMEFTFSELKTISDYKYNGKKRFATELDKLVYEKLLSVKYHYTTIENGKEVKKGGVLFPTYKIIEADEMLYLGVNSELEYFLNDLTKEFTRFELEEFLSLRSAYAKNMYKHLKQWRTVGKKEIPIEIFRELLDIPESYTMRSITQRVLAPIETELSPIFKGLKINKIHHGRGNKVKALEFSFSKESIPKHTKPIYSKVKKENLPEWANNNTPATETELTPEAKAKLDKRIAKLKSSGKEA